MPSTLLLAGSASAADDRWSLDEHDEEALAAALRDLAPYSAEPAKAALVHERSGTVIAAWSTAGALRLAQLLPPAYADLRDVLVQRHGRTQE